MLTADDLLSGSTAADEEASSGRTEAQSDDNRAGDPEETSPALQAVLDAGYTIEELRDALLPAIRADLQREVREGYKATQSVLMSTVGQVLRETRPLREQALIQEELDRQQYGHEDYEAARTRAKQRVEQQDLQVKAQAYDELVAERQRQQDSRQDGRQQDSRQQQPDPNNPEAHWPVVSANILRYARKAGGEEKGLDRDTVIRLLPKKPVASFITDDDPTGWDGYQDAAEKAIDDEVTRVERARRPRPRTDTTRPAAGGAPAAQGSRASFERAFGAG